MNASPRAAQLGQNSTTLIRCRFVVQRGDVAQQIEVSGVGAIDVTPVEHDGLQGGEAVTINAD